MQCIECCSLHLLNIQFIFIQFFYLYLYLSKIEKWELFNLYLYLLKILERFIKNSDRTENKIWELCNLR